MKPVIAYHLVFGAYGFWLPNDPRGSWSDAVYATRLQPFGPVNQVSSRASQAGAAHDRDLRMAAKAALLRPAVQFDAAQIECIAAAIGDESNHYELVVLAAAIMPDHVHLVTARHQRSAEEWIGFLKRAASRELTRRLLHPFAGCELAGGRVPTPWGEGGWNVFLDDEAEVAAAIRYVEQNPTKTGLAPQNWDFVRPYRCD